MKDSTFRTRYRLLAALLIAGAVSAPLAAAAETFPKATPESQGLSSQSLADLLTVARGFADKGDIVGGELMVIKNRRTVLHETVGFGDLEKKKPLKRDTIYCIRSMTKPLAGAAIQMLIDEGKLSLDDPAAKYLPSFDNDKSRGITIRQLLTHTSGLPLSTLMTTDFRTLTSLREVADLTATNGPTIPPGSGFQYSDDGTDTLGAIIQVITGKPAEVFIGERILAPLGMRDTFPLVTRAGKKISRFTPAYMGSRGSWVRLWSPDTPPLFPYFLASQAMYSTTSDYARFLALYMDGGVVDGKRLLSEAAIQRTLAPANATGFPDGFPKLSIYYGQLMMDYVDDAGKVVAFGHGGSDGTFAYAWPEQDLMVLFYTQSRGNNTSLPFEAAIDRLLLGGSGDAPVDDVTAQSAAPYLGAYYLEPKQLPMFVVWHKESLALEFPWQGLAELRKIDEPDAWSLVEAPDNTVKFRREGGAPASAFEFRTQRPLTLKRFEPAKGLPTVDDLLKRRPDTQRAAKLASLGVLRMTGTLESSAAKQKGSFDVLLAGEDRSHLTVRMAGNESIQVVNGERAWMRQLASMPAQELPANMARAMKLNGWLLATGDWRKEFASAQVLMTREVDGKKMFLVHAAPAEGRQRLLHIDGDTGLVMGYDEVQELPGLGLVGCEVRFSDYRDVEGVQIPYKATVAFPTPLIGTLTYQVEKIETRVKQDRDPFTLK